MLNPSKPGIGNKFNINQEQFIIAVCRIIKYIIYLISLFPGINLTYKARAIVAINPIVKVVISPPSLIFKSSL